MALISMVAMTVQGEERLPPPFLISAQPRRIDAVPSGWHVDGERVRAGSEVTFRGARWFRRGSGWVRYGDPGHYFERRGDRWVEFVSGVQASEITVSVSSRSVTLRRGDPIYYLLSGDGSLSRALEVPHMSPARTPSRFERSLTQGTLHNPPQP